MVKKRVQSALGESGRHGPLKRGRANKTSALQKGHQTELTQYKTDRSTTISLAHGDLG